MDSLNCIIIDDIKTDALSVLSLLKKHSNYNVLGVFNNTLEAKECIENNTIDIAFLDIELPGESGIDFRKRLMNVPVCIFVSSFPEYALEGFDVEAFDFITKPLDEGRFVKTVNRIDEYFVMKIKASFYEEGKIENDTFIVKERNNIVKIKFQDILFLEALKDYTTIVTAQKRYYFLANLGKLLKEPFFESFIRIHRSYAVQKNYIFSISRLEITLNNEIKIPIGKSYKDNVKLLQ